MRRRVIEDLRTRIKQSIEPLRKLIGLERFAKLREIVRTVHKLLVKEDRIMWYLNFVKYHFIMDAIEEYQNQISKMELSDEASIPKDIEDKLAKLTRAATKIERKFTNTDALKESSLRAVSKDTLDQLQHFVDLLDSADFDSFSYNTDNYLQDFLRYLATKERELASKSTRMVTPKPEDTVVMTLEDGFVWMLLPRMPCSDEAKAMGHCAHDPRGDAILSLRRDMGNGKYKVYATFTYNTEYKVILEMKGPRNAKPSRSLHKYIVPLLLNKELVQGILGGGYLPKNNFSLDDLDPKIREQVLSLRPELDVANFIRRHKDIGPALLQLFNNIGVTTPYGVFVTSTYGSGLRLRANLVTDRIIYQLVEGLRKEGGIPDLLPYIMGFIHNELIGATLIDVFKDTVAEWAQQGGRDLVFSEYDSLDKFMKMVFMAMSTSSIGVTVTSNKDVTASKRADAKILVNSLRLLNLVDAASATIRKIPGIVGENDLDYTLNVPECDVSIKFSASSDSGEISSNDTISLDELQCLLDQDTKVSLDEDKIRSPQYAAAAFFVLYAGFLRMIYDASNVLGGLTVVIEPTSSNQDDEDLLADLEGNVNSDVLSAMSGMIDKILSNTKMTYRLIFITPLFADKLEQRISNSKLGPELIGGLKDLTLDVLSELRSENEGVV